MKPTQLTPVGKAICALSPEVNARAKASRATAAADTAEKIAPIGLMTPKQTADYLQVPEGTLAVWRCTNRVILPFLKLGGRHVRYRKEDLDRFIADGLRNTQTA